MKKYLVLFMAALMVCWLGGIAGAGWVEDTGMGSGMPCGEGSPKDLDSARCDLLKDATHPDEAPWLLLGLEMCASSSIPGFQPGMPGLVVWEFDVDHDSNTGGISSMQGIPLPGSPNKKVKGYDIVVMQAIRDQGTGSAMAWCKGCAGSAGAVCATRGGTCEGSCYLIDEYCPVGGPGCYELGSACGTTPNCYELTTDCPIEDCDMGRQQGEWYASMMAGSNPGGQGYTWGRSIPLPPLPTQTTDLTFIQKVPYRDIVTRALDAGMPCSLTLEQVMALAPRWQVSIYYDDVSGDGDDYVTYTPLGLDINDWMPHDNDPAGPYAQGEIFNIDYNTCKEYSDQGTCEADGCYWKADKGKCITATCNMDGSGDGKANNTDFGILKNEFGRIDCLVCQ